MCNENKDRCKTFFLIEKMLRKYAILGFNFERNAKIQILFLNAIVSLHTRFINLKRFVDLETNKKHFI